MTVSRDRRPSLAAELRERLRGTLTAGGVAVTAQRRLIFEELAMADDHPSAEQLHVRLRRRLPELSLATVYKNLHLFSRLRLAQAVATPDGKAHFEGNVEPHHHLRCLRCDSVVDLFEPRVSVAVAPDLEEATGFTLERTDVHLLGVCRECRRRARGKAPLPALRRRPVRRHDRR